MSQLSEPTRGLVKPQNQPLDLPRLKENFLHKTGAIEEEHL